VTDWLVDEADRSIGADRAAWRQWIQLRIEEGRIKVAGPRRYDGVVARTADDHPGNRWQQVRSRQLSVIAAALDRVAWTPTVPRDGRALRESVIATRGLQAGAGYARPWLLTFG
jgi:hypothetical protein